jgi:hypothetical protein
VAQLGSGLGSDYPSAIDTRQTFQNVVNAAPDSNTRLDSELANDSLDAIIQIETALGAGIQGAYGSLAARLLALEAGGGGPGPSGMTNVVPFVEQTTVTIPGSAHQQGQQALLYHVYAAGTPRYAVQPETFRVYPSTFDAVVTFGAAESGTIVVAALTPQYVTGFTTTGSVPTATILGSAHGLTPTYLFVQAYDLATPAQAIELGSVTINATTKDVTLTTGTAMSGTVVLAVGTPRFVQAFTNQSSVNVPGSTHGLASPNLVYQVYDASTNPTIIEEGSLSVDPTSFNVVLTFAAPQSGTLLLAPVPPVSAPTLLLAPAARVAPMPLIAPVPRPRVPERAVLVLQTLVTDLTARLATLEAAYQTLQTQLGTPNAEDPTT